MNQDPDSPDYCDHNLGDERETPEEKEISRLQTELIHLRAESLRLVSANDALEKERDGLREQLGKAVLTAVTNGKEALAAQTAEARLRGALQITEQNLDNPQSHGQLRREVIAHALSTPPTAALPDDGSDLIPRGLLLEIKITVDNDFNVTTINRGAPCRDFSKMERAYLAARAELDSFITRGPQDCPLAPARAAIAGATK